MLHVGFGSTSRGRVSRRRDVETLWLYTPGPAVRARFENSPTPLELSSLRHRVRARVASPSLAAMLALLLGVGCGGEPSSEAPPADPPSGQAATGVPASTAPDSAVAATGGANSPSGLEGGAAPMDSATPTAAPDEAAADADLTTAAEAESDDPEEAAAAASGSDVGAGVNAGANAGADAGTQGGGDAGNVPQEPERKPLSDKEMLRALDDDDVSDAEFEAAFGDKRGKGGVKLPGASH